MITDGFDRGARTFPDRVFMMNSTTSSTYREAYDASHAIACGLEGEGLNGASVGLLAPNDPEAFIAMLGVLRAGATCVPLNGRDHIDALVEFMRVTEIAALIYHTSYEHHLDLIRESVPSLHLVIPITDGDTEEFSIRGLREAYAGRTCTVRRALDDIALIKASGGTTGRPKPIMQSHRCLQTAYRILAQHCPVADTPVHLIVGPLTHVAGALTMAFSALGMTNVIAPSADPGEVLSSIERERVTHIFLPPTMIYRLLAHPDLHRRDASSLECLIYGAAPMSPDKLKSGLEVWGPVFVQIYGQSEAPAVITCLSRQDHYVSSAPNGDRQLRSVGRPTGACEVALMADDGELVAPGERGEVVVRGDLVFPGYYRNESATAEARAFGWHHTGDIGQFDDSGYLYLVDRKKDVVISGGFNIYPSEVENVIMSHPAVQDCAVLGVPDPDWGERLTAIIQLKQGMSASAEQIAQMCRDRLGGVKTPKRIDFWQDLPRSTVGKVLKTAIKARLGTARSDPDGGSHG